MNSDLKADHTSTSIATNLYQTNIHRYLLRLYRRYSITSVRLFWLHAIRYIGIVTLIAAAVKGITSFSKTSTNYH
jgi:hypothetical protein